MFTGQPQGASQLTQGATLYIFNRKDFSVAMASVLNVSQPHVSKAAQTNPALGMQGFVVDLTLSMGNETTSVEYPVNSQGANYPEKGWYISPDQAAVSREVEAANNNSKQFLAQIPYHEMVVKKAPALQMQLNPKLQMEAQQAEKIARLENQLAEISGKFDQMVGMLSAAVQKNEKPKEEK
jgi:hypothetical protein